MQKKIRKLKRAINTIQNNNIMSDLIFKDFRVWFLLTQTLNFMMSLVQIL